jgi:hypothetical protein
MPRKQRTSPVLEKTEQRLLGFQSINPNLDFGDSISLDHLTQLTTQLSSKLDQYNLMLHDIDSAKDEIEKLEKTIRETSERLVNGVAFKYGKDSREYELAGGVRKSDRIRKATITRLKSTAGTTPATSQPD